MRVFSLVLAAGMLTGCPRPGGATVMYIVRAPMHPTHNVVADAHSSSGALLLVHSTAGAAQGPLVARLGSTLTVDKITNVVALLDAIEAAQQEDPELHVYLQIDPTRTTRRRLMAIGFVPDTMAGDVATGRLRVSALGQVLWSEMVHRLELPHPVRLRLKK